jgi:hypothetical protein
MRENARGHYVGSKRAERDTENENEHQPYHGFSIGLFGIH